MGVVSSMQGGGEEMQTHFRSRNLKGKDNLSDLNVDRRIILKCMLDV
jgi:hypothetical protein